ncbi:hypothetical protein HYY69_01835 [Candidatus Woesearchaeota archaeon]|nr:hypothetical protein [Candidatus Woesearchaeota archaeon]
MSKKRLWLYFAIFLFLIDFALAGEVYYITQDQENSYFAFSGSPSYKDVQQTFVAPQDFTITAIALNLKALNPQGCGVKLLRIEVLDQNGNYVTDSGWLGDFENAAGSLYYNFPGYGYLNNYFDFVKIPLLDTTKDNLMSGKQYQLRIYTNVCSSSSETNPAFALAGSTSDVYSGGQASAKPASFQIKDFSFKVLGYTPQPTCKEDKICENNQIVQIYADCSKQYLQTCSGDYVCETGSCLYKYPLMNIAGFNIYKNDNYIQPETSFVENDKTTFYLSTENANGKPGSYTTTITVYDSNNNIVSLSNNPYTETRTSPSFGNGDVVKWPVIIDSSFKQGQYKAVANVQNCKAPSTCSVEKIFYVGSTCYDKDNDGVTTCQGDCNDNDASASSSKTCLYDGNSCGIHQLCINQCPSVPVEVCDGVDNNCDLQKDENNVCSAMTYYCDNDGDGSISKSVSGTCSTFNCLPSGCTLIQGTDCDDSNNNVNPKKSELLCDQLDNDCNVNTKDDNCENGMSCNYDSKQCSINSEDVDYIFINTKGFIFVADKTNAYETTVFEEIFDEYEPKYSAVLLTGQQMKNFAGVLDDFLLELGQYEYVAKEVIIDSSEYGKVKVYSVGPQTEIGKISDDMSNLVKNNPLAKRVKNFFGTADSAINILDVSLALIHGFEKANESTTEDQIFVALVYAGEEIVDGYKNMLIFADEEISNAVYIHSYGLIHINTPLKDLGNFLDTFKVSNKNGDTCLGFWKWISCIMTINDVFTHPLTFITNADYSAKNNSINFLITVKNYWQQLIGGKIFLGATISDRNGYSCNLPWKELNFAPGEVQSVSLSKQNLDKNKEYILTTKLWYQCTFGCEDASGCYKDGCCNYEAFQTSYDLNFTLDNNPPIINDIKLNDISYQSIFYEGENISIEFIVSDLDDNDIVQVGIVDYSLFTFLGLSGCEKDFAGSKHCNFLFTTKQGEAGTYNLTLYVTDGYDTVYKTIPITLYHNSPQITYPQQNDITNTQNPTFKWNAIVGQLPISYTINIFEDIESNLIFTKELGDPNQGNIVKQHTLTDITLKKDKNYFVQIVALNNNGVTLASEKVTFYVDCITDLQCGDPTTSLYCGADGHSYQETTTPTCVNPGTLQSQCVTETTTAKINSCSYGCQNGACNTLISTPDTTDDAELSYVGNQAILDWRVNDLSIASLNLPFEPHTESTTKVKDYSENKNDAVVNSALFKPTEGHDGKGAYYFAGNNAAIISTQPIDLSKYTVSLWIKPEIVSGFKNFIYIPESKRYFAISNGVCSWTGTIWSCTKKAPLINTWTHIAITSDGNVYQNGVYDGRIRVLPLTGIASFGDRDQSAYDFKGLIDDIKIYNKVLSLQQIQKLANKQQNIIVSEETQPNDVWSVAATNNDGAEDAETIISNTITIKHGINSFTPMLVSSDGEQTTDTSNLLLTQLVEPPLKNIIDWRVNGISIASLNLPLEAHAESATKVKDYSTNKNDAVVNGAMFKSNTGYDGKGAYYFTTNTGITTAQPINVSKYTVSLWVKPEVVTGYRNFIYIPETKRYFSINNGVCSWTGTIWSCTKKAPAINTWTHITITSEGNVYQNGVYDARIKVLPLLGILVVGDRDQSAYDFKGYIDGVKVYNRVLSPEQISQLANGKEDLLVHQETVPQQQWQAAVTANNGVKDGITKFTNTVIIS